MKQWTEGPIGGNWIGQKRAKVDITTLVPSEHLKIMQEDINKYTKERQHRAKSKLKVRWRREHQEEPCWTILDIAHQKGLNYLRRRYNKMVIPLLLTAMANTHTKEAW